MTYTLGRITLPATSHTCPDCMRGLPCERQPVESSLSRVVAEAVNGSATQCDEAAYARHPLTFGEQISDTAFKAPIYFGHQRTDSEWKRDTFPQETM